MRKIAFKRIASILLLLAFHCSFLPAEAEGTAVNNSTNTNSENRQYYRGDVNLDGKVSIADISSLVAHLMGVTSVPYRKETADADKNGIVNQEDLNLIVNWILTGTNGGKVTLEDDDDHTSGTTPSMPWG